MKEYEYEINGTSYRVTVKEVLGEYAEVEVNGIPYEVHIKSVSSASPTSVESRSPAPQPAPQAPAPRPSPQGAAQDGLISAPMPGVVIKLLVSKGDRVNSGDAVMIVEAMKMENEIKTAQGGTVEDIFVDKGDSVNTGDRLLRIAGG